jgi:hypothetical protein
VPDTPEVRATIAALLRDGATYAQVRTKIAASPNLISSVRKEQQIPVREWRRRGRNRTHQSLEEAFAKHTAETADGHRRYTGGVQVGSPKIYFDGGRQMPLRAAGFLLHYGREPAGYTRSGCGESWCVAGAHAEDRPMRERLRAQLRAIGGHRA